MEQEKPKSIFFQISDALRGDKKDVVDAINKKDLLIAQPSNQNSNSNDFQQLQQDYLDFQSIKIAQDIYGRTTYYDSDRISAYSDFRAMDNSPEISVALDIMADECVGKNEKGEMLAIYSKNDRIKKVLQNLFYQTLNINSNAWIMTRELLKYGDNMYHLLIDQKIGIYDIRPLPVDELHKKIGVDGNPRTVRYTWDNKSIEFEEWQVAHFCLMSDGTKLPYGRSILDPARKLWKQLQLAEDAMLVYRLVRAPERRVFYVEVGNSNPTDIKQYVDSMKRELKKSPVVDQRTGNVNLKFNPITFEEDYFIPVRGGVSSKVETLPGATNLGDIADIEYLQNKLFTAIKVPKTYLNYGEALPGGSTLSQSDLRFSRTINRIQEMLVLEFRKIANIHLYLLGFHSDLNNFTLALTNPNSQQELLKLEIMKARNEVFKEMFSSDATSPVSYSWAMENILGFSKRDVLIILRQKKIERKMFYEIERAHLEYMDTGIFTKLDRKFRKADFDPNTDIDPDAEPGESGEGGGGSQLSSHPPGGQDINLGGGGGGMPSDTGGEEFGMGDGGSPLSSPDLGSGAPEDMEEPTDNLKEDNKLLKHNQQFNFNTKLLLEGIDSFLNKLDDKEIPPIDEVNTDLNN